MSWTDLVPTFIICFLNLRLVVGAVDAGECYHFVTLHWMNDPSEEEILAGVAVDLYWLLNDRPMFSLQLFPRLDAYLFWISPRPPTDSESM